MPKKILSVLLQYAPLITGLMIACANVAMAAEISTFQQNENIELEKEYQQDLQQLEPFQAPKEDSLNRLDVLGKQLQLKWSNRDANHYANLMLEVSQMFASGYFGVSNIYNKSTLAQKYAYLGLERIDETSIGIETQLVFFLSEDLEYNKGELTDQQWEQLRLKKAKLWFHALQRIQKQIDPQFDFKGYQRYVPPPVGYENMMTPVPPEAIADLKVRAEYEAAIEKNKQLLQKIREQNFLRKLEKTFSLIAEDYLIAAYFKSSYNLNELKQLLDTYDVGAERKARILAAVKKNTGVVDEAPKQPATATPAPKPKTPQKPTARKPG